MLLIRLVILSINIVELFALYGIITINHGVSLPWVLYQDIAYLVFLELPHFILIKTNTIDTKKFNLFIFFFILDYVVDFLGNLFNAFNNYWWYDIFTHVSVLSWVACSLMLNLTLSYLKTTKLDFSKNQIFLSYIIFCGAMTLLCVHEMVEASIDYFSVSNAGTGSSFSWDTGKDLFVDAVGCLCFLVIRHAVNKKRGGV